MTVKNSKKTLLELFPQDRKPALDESPSLSFSLFLSFTFLEGVQAGELRLNPHLVWPYGKIEYRNKCLYTAYDYLVVMKYRTNQLHWWRNNIFLKNADCIALNIFDQSKHTMYFILYSQYKQIGHEGASNNPRSPDFDRAGTAPPGFQIPWSATVDRQLYNCKLNSSKSDG